MIDVSALPTDELQRKLKAARRIRAIKEARTSLLAFTRLNFPDLDDQDDALKTRYDTQVHHKVIVEALERVEAGKCLRLALSVPPQFGKSELADRQFIPWYHGRNPTHSIMFGTYNEKFAWEQGADVRSNIEGAAFKAVFPHYTLRGGSKSKDLLVNTEKGRISFIGRGGSGTGKPARLVIIDDPLKNATEAESPTTRKELHEWFTKVIYSRARGNTAIIIIHTRWHEDDLIGRLCDPDHPDHDPDLAKEWTYINIPAVLHDGPMVEALGLRPVAPTDPLVISAFGDKPSVSLWETEFPLRHLATAAKQNPVGFNALYMGKPTPDDGEFFKKEWFVEYDADELPPNLRVYGASDHAITEQQQNDACVLGCFGVDHNSDIWVLPDLVWDRMETPQMVEEMLALMQRRKPLVWWPESENILKSIGPFLRTRQVESNIYTLVDPLPAIKDKRAQARSIQGRMSQRKVRFPKFAPWWRNAKAELLKFPFATHDDFVTFMSLIGLGLDKEFPAEHISEIQKETVVVGSYAWIKQQSAKREAREKRLKAVAGW